MDTEHPNRLFVSASSAAERLGVTASWLKAEARAGRVPFLQAGGKRLFNVATVEAALLARATTAVGQEASR